MAYLSKESVLKAYKKLSEIDASIRQGTTQRVSALRYFLALDRFYKERSNDCDLKVATDKSFFTQCVGEIVAISDNYYTTNFYFPLENAADFNCGSNFYSVGVVTASQNDPDTQFNYPRRGNNPLFHVTNQTLIHNFDLYSNVLVFFRGSTEYLAAFTVWVLRNYSFETQDVSGLRSALSTKYTQQMVDVLLPESISAQITPYLEFVDENQIINIDDIREVIVDNSQVSDDEEGEPLSLTPMILYGPPGTGKTYKMQTKFMNRFSPENLYVTTFHQSFSYEDFIEGLKPVLDGLDGEDVSYQIENGIFRQACERAAIIAGFNGLDDCISNANRTQIMNQAIQDNKFVLLCIDEINRANVSAVFGDLITLIEDSKRIGSDNEMIVRLPYSKCKFGVPKNLLILGTMNTADRSIQLLDTALRRRFVFKELLPDYTRITNTKAKNILTSINNRLRALLNKDSQIGHAYFTHVANEGDELSIFNVVRDKIIPLLEEYFYNESTKIRLVLNEVGTTDTAHNFYKEDVAAKSAYDRMGLDGDVDFFSLDSASLSAVSSNEEASLFLEHLM